MTQPQEQVFCWLLISVCGLQHINLLKTEAGSLVSSAFIYPGDVADAIQVVGLSSMLSLWSCETSQLSEAVGEHGCSLTSINYLIKIIAHIL